MSWTNLVSTQETKETTLSTVGNYTLVIISKTTGSTYFGSESHSGRSNMLTTPNGAFTQTNRPEGMPSQNGLTNIKKAGANASAFLYF
jgi:hypothetical protein